LEETWIGGELKVQKSKEDIINFMIDDLEKVIRLFDLYFILKQNNFFHVAFRLEEL